MTSEEFRTNPLFLRDQFRGEGVFELPVIHKEEMSLANIELIGYDNLYRGETQKVVHFFLDDYKFEALWNRPDSKIDRLREYRAVLSPQFSVYTEMPLSLQLYNIFRSRWCGAYLQRQGVKVIPTVYWGKPASFWFCFDGIETGSAVAVSTVGVRTEKTLFLQGYTEMMKRVQPEAVLCYGKPFEEMDGRIIEIDYAKTNRLAAENPGVPAKEEKCLGSSHSSILVFKQGHVTSIWEEKGMGSAGNRNALPPNDAQIKHMFRNDEGHLPDTAASRELLLRVANDESCYLGTDENGVKWYAEIQQDGTQVWVRVWEQTIFNGGVNHQPHSWNPETGLNAPRKSGGNYHGYFIRQGLFGDLPCFG